MQSPLECVVIDGYVWLDEAQKAGLGAHLFAALEGKTPVIGVAKTHFLGAPASEVKRGSAERPLYVRGGCDKRSGSRSRCQNAWQLSHPNVTQAG